MNVIRKERIRAPFEGLHPNEGGFVQKGTGMAHFMKCAALTMTERKREKDLPPERSPTRPPGQETSGSERA